MKALTPKQLQTVGQLLDRWAYLQTGDAMTLTDDPELIDEELDSLAVRVAQVLRVDFERLVIHRGRYFVVQFIGLDPVISEPSIVNTSGDT